jgi:RimJ/RimL family protein N-acetyltransferase
MSRMTLTSVYTRPDRCELLYRLLAERGEEANISHKEMPNFVRHTAFVESHPYEAWYFICDPEPVGACYLTRQNEIGVFVFAEHQKKGYARQAITTLIEKHGPGRYLANVSPRNEASRFLFHGLGFKHCQDTYEMVA